jgi:hypothetical protein
MELYEYSNQDQNEIFFSEVSFTAVFFFAPNVRKSVGVALKNREKGALEEHFTQT